jgi:serine/threonine protein kinase
MRLTQSSLAAIGEGLKFGGGVVVQQIPKEGMSVVVKVAKQSGRSDKEFYMENVRENVVHRRLSADSCSFVPAASKPICVSKYVPKFYLSFIDGSPKKLESVTVMDVAGNVSLDKFVKGKKIPVDFYVDIERAICSLWLSGYIHGDLHRDNIMIDTNTQRIQIIDFGFAIKMPAGFVSVLSRRISNMIAQGHTGSLGDVWLKKPINDKLRLINYSNRVMKGRGFPWYNPDYKVLQSLFNQVPRDLRKNIPAARAAAWGIQLQQVPRQPLVKKQTVQKKQTPFASSPLLRASAAKTYRSSKTVRRPLTASPPKPMSQQYRTVTPPQQKPRTVTPPQQKPRTVTPPQQKPRTVTPPQQYRTVTPHQQYRTATPPQQYRTATPQQKSMSKQKSVFQKIRSSSPQIRTPSPMNRRLSGLSNAERAAVYGSKQRELPRALNALRQRKEACGRRGLAYNPITKQCIAGQQQIFTGCRQDCARIGKRCGPKGKCVKL